MYKCISLFIFLFIVSVPGAQQLPFTIAESVKKLEADPQMKHALVGFQVMEALSGKLVYSRNAEIGLGVASSQKVFTAATAFELLGKEFRYFTGLSISHRVLPDGNSGPLYINGNGDPTLGSWRYKETADTLILNRWISWLKKKGIKNIHGGIIISEQNHASSLASPIPEGYIWQDIGNYYGAGTSLVNWRENQYDVVFSSGASGEKATIVSIAPQPPGLKFKNLVTAGSAGSGDNAYIFSAPYAEHAFINGTIPPNSKRFTISGSMPDPAATLGYALKDALLKNGIGIDSAVKTFSKSGSINYATLSADEMDLDTDMIYSPTLDSIIYWFLKRSINLYGETLVKTFSSVKTGSFQLEAGLENMKDFWVKKGIDKSAMHLYDGSGLSPSNRVTVSSLVQVMKFARGRPWYNSFYEALPVINGIRMKSGTIGGVRSFTGYVKSRSGKEYIFAIVVNNFDGTGSQIVQKMYKILNILK